MKNNIPLKYACLDNFDNISSKCNDIEIKTLLHELRDLIFYQMRDSRSTQGSYSTKT